ncbi:MAG: hypothetical protein OHK0053_00660 [Microscillaceae bacterium]
MDIKEIRALVSLLDDEDQEVIAHVEQKIMSLGDVIIPFLESEWETSFSTEVQRRIEDLIHNLQFETLCHRLHIWRQAEQDDLLRGLWIVATYQYPDLDFKKLKKDFESIYHEVWLSHRTYASPYDQIKNLNNVLYSKLGFSSNTQNLYAPSNSMINLVIETRRGNPIALGTIYMMVAQRLRMPVFGVNLPNIFVLTYKSEEAQFYINAYNRGTVFPRSDIDSYIAQLKLEPEERFYEPCQHLDIVRRVIVNLSLAFEKLGETAKVEELRKVLEILT